MHPAWAERLQREQDRVCALLDRRRAVMCRDRTSALLTIAHAVIQRYRAEKARRGLLDYDDLIDHALALFQKTSAAWVLYKLDLGIDHVLIDEAQDTSPKQWAIIEALTGEFTAGAGARPRRAHDLCRRRREAIDLLVPGRRAALVRARSASRSSAPSRRPNCNGGPSELQTSFRSGRDRAARG